MHKSHRATTETIEEATSILQAPAKPQEVPIHITDEMGTQAATELGLKTPQSFIDYNVNRNKINEFWQRRSNPDSWQLFDAQVDRLNQITARSREDLGMRPAQSFGEYTIQVANIEEYLGTEGGQKILAEHPPVQDLEDIHQNN
jgi:hypothetical protein